MLTTMESFSEKVFFITYPTGSDTRNVLNTANRKPETLETVYRLNTFMEFVDLPAPTKSRGGRQVAPPIPIDSQAAECAIYPA